MTRAVRRMVSRPPCVCFRALAAALLCASLVLNACRPQPGIDQRPIADTWLEDATAQAGIEFRHQRGPTRYWLPEIMSGGAAWLDFDADGLLDLYLVQGGDVSQQGTLPGNVLWRNLGDGRFADVTAQAGVGDTHFGMGVAVGDYDGDGRDDLYVTNVGPNVLYRNRGDGSFEDVTESAGVGDSGWGTSAAFVDYDLDGDQDLFVVNYIRWSPQTEIDCRTEDNLPDYCAPSSYQAPAIDVLYRNDGNGKFTDVTRQAGITAAFGNGLGVAVGDLNDDGQIDFYVANDGTPNQLWIQQPDGTFQDRALLSGCSVNRMGAAEAGMGVAAVDVENDGDLDLFMTHLGTETNTLYVNQGHGMFDDRSAVSGLGAPSFNYTGFGLVFADFDHDRRLDVYVANGRVGRNLAPLVPEDVFAEPNQLFRGLGKGRFEEVARRGGCWPELIENSRAAAYADYDNDGDVDLLIVNNGGPARLLRNRQSSGASWIKFRVLDRHGLDAVAARVRIETAGHVQWRNVGRASSYLASNDPLVHFGLADVDRLDDVQVVWPGGSRESFGAHNARQTITLRQGSGGR